MSRGSRPPALAPHRVDPHQIAPPRALYLHVPFCTSKCRYCAFHSTTDWTPRTTRAISDAILADLDDLAPALATIRTVYVGGGTPTTLAVGQLVDLVTAPARLGSRPWEITVEANPESADPELLAALATAGVTRLSVGVQTLEPAVALTLGRRLTTRAELEAIRASWPRELSVDLIHGAPGSQRRDFGSSLRSILDLGIEHVSLYGLTVEPGTPLAGDVRRGAVRVPDVGTEWDDALEALAGAGLERYEVSNFAMPGCECRHNQTYWRGEPYLGLGPSATSTLVHDRSHLRITQPRDHARFLERTSPLDGEIEVLGEADLRVERLMLGLRSREGIALHAYRETLGDGRRREFDEAVRSQVDAGLLVQADARLCPTALGMDLLDRVLDALLPPIWR